VYHSLGSNTKRLNNPPDLQVLGWVVSPSLSLKVPSVSHRTRSHCCMIEVFMTEMKDLLCTTHLPESPVC
jgi:hypothetical protein